MPPIPQWAWFLFVAFVVICIIVFVGGDCSFSIGDFSAGGGSK